MKFVCDSCERLAEMRDFRIDRGMLLVRCDKCGFESKAVAPASPLAAPALSPLSPLTPSSLGSAPAPTPFVPKLINFRGDADAAGKAAMAAADSDAALEVPPGRCQKCIAKRPEGALSCAQCGLTFDNARPEELLPSSPLVQAWRETLRRWSEESAHDQLLQQAVLRSELPQAGRLYRIRLALFPEDPMAVRGRDEVLRLASLSAQTMSIQKDHAGKEHAEGIKPWQAVAVIFVFVLFIGALFSYLFKSVGAVP